MAKNILMRIKDHTEQMLHSVNKILYWWVNYVEYWVRMLVCLRLCSIERCIVSVINLINNNRSIVILCFGQNLKIIYEKHWRFVGTKTVACRFHGKTVGTFQFKSMRIRCTANLVSFTDFIYSKYLHKNANLSRHRYMLYGSGYRNYYSLQLGS